MENRYIQVNLAFQKKHKSFIEKDKIKSNIDFFVR